MSGLTWGQVLSFRLRRQHLARDCPANSLEEAARDSAGLQAQAMPATELSLLARTGSLQAGELDHALWEQKRLVRTWCMRGTLHVIPAEDMPLFMAATQRGNSGFHPALLNYLSITEEEATAVVDAVGRVLDDGCVRTRKQLAAEVEALVGPRFHDMLLSGWGSFLKPAAWRGMLICGPPRGTEVTFVGTRHWLGAWEPVDRHSASVELVRRYLRGYGPATLAEFTRWAGLRSAARVRPAWTECHPEMAEVEVEGTRLWAMADDVPAMLAAEPSQEVRLVPNFDSYLLGHIDRSAMVSAQHAGRIYRTAGWVWATVLKGGRAVGVWSSKRNGRAWKVEVEEFAPLGRTDRRAVGEEVERMAAFLGLKPEVQIK